jgi:hypothetical protein
MRRWVLGVAAAGWLVVAASPAMAIVYRFTSSDSNGPIVLTLEFLDGAADENAAVGVGRYGNSAVSLLLQTNTFTMQHSGPFDFASVNVLNPAQESFTVLHSTGLVVDPAGAANPSAGLILAGPGLLGGSEALPTLLPPTLGVGFMGAIIYEQADGDLFYGTIRTIEVNPQAVPEPATAALWLGAMAALSGGLLRRRR